MLEIGTTYYEVTETIHGINIEKVVVVAPVTHKGYVGGDLAGDVIIEPSEETATADIYNVETDKLVRTNVLLPTMQCEKVLKLLDSGWGFVETNFGFIFLDKSKAVKYFNELISARIQKLQSRCIS